LNRLYKSTALSLALLAVLIWWACGKKAEGPATAEETAAEVGVPATPPENLRGALTAKVAEVDQYMKGHHVKNTKPAEIAAQLESYRKDFEELAARAGEDDLAAQFNLAAEAMGLYVQSLRAPKEDMSSRALAIEAEAKWTEVRKSAAGEPAS
jgi:hypothetical protein